jgi:hypothetical protein
MRLARFASCALSFLLLVTFEVAGIEVHVGNLTVTATNAYGVLEDGKVISLVHHNKKVRVQVVMLDEFPPATRESIHDIVDSVERTQEVVVTHVKSATREKVSLLTGEGTVKLGDEAAHFWFLSIPVGDRAAAGVAFSPQDEQDVHKAELLEILKSISSKLDGTARFFDFETGGLRDRWTAQGPIAVERQRPPIVYDLSKSKDMDAPLRSQVPMDHAIHLTSSGKSVFLAVEGLVPQDWTELEAVSFWVYQADRTDPPTTIELQVYGSNPRARFWRKLVIDHEGWRSYSVPLRWMRWGEYHVPAWYDIGRFGIYFRDTGDIWIDSITLEDTDAQRGSTIEGADLAELAFPDRTKDVKFTDSQDLVLVSGTAEMSPDELLKHVSATKKQIETDFAFLPATRYPPKLVVLPAQADYRHFIQKMAAALNSQVAVPKSDGFTLQDVSVSYWDPAQGTLRPVYTHEYVHGLLSHMLRFNNQGDWFHEGAAAYYQLQAHPQANLSEIVRKGSEDRSFSTPLEELCNGKRIPMNRYWQAMTIVELLLTDDAYRKKLPELIASFQANGSTDLGPPLKGVLHKTWEQITDDWRNHCRARY